MDPQPDVIRQQIGETRSSLTEKLETLEAEVKDTVQSARDSVESAKDAVEETFLNAKETVQDTISSVKESVENATESVKRNLDVEYQVDQHPWFMMGLSLVSGVALGAFLGSRMNSGRRLAAGMSEASVTLPERSSSGIQTRLTHQDNGRPGFTDKLGSQLGAEFEKVKDLAIDALVGVIGNVARKSIPALASSVEEMMTRAAEQMGAPPQQYGREHSDVAATPTYSTPPQY